MLFCLHSNRETANIEKKVFGKVPHADSMKGSGTFKGTFIGPVIEWPFNRQNHSKILLKYYLYCSITFSAHRLLQCNITNRNHICFSLLLKHWVFRVGAVRRSGPTPDRWFWHGCPGLLQPGRSVLKLGVLRLRRRAHRRRQQPSRLTTTKRRPKNPGNSVYVRKEKLPPQARASAPKFEFHKCIGRINSPSQPNRIHTVDTTKSWLFKPLFSVWPLLLGKTSFFYPTLTRLYYYNLPPDCLPFIWKLIYPSAWTDF